MIRHIREKSDKNFIEMFLPIMVNSCDEILSGSKDYDINSEAFQIGIKTFF